MNEEEKNIQANNNVEQNGDAIVNQIATSETKEEAAPIAGAKQEAADFSSMFGVQSEETQEEKDLAKQTNTEIPRVLEVKEEDREVVVQLSDEEKKANHKKNFNNDERLLYQIEPDKIGNPLVVLFFFLILFSAIIFLPKIAKKVDFSQFFKVTKTEKKEEVKEEQSDFYRIESAASRAKIGTLEMINFSKAKEDGEYIFSFTIQNVGDKMYQFNEKYYVVFYNDDTPLYYALIHSYNGIASKSAQDITLIINQKVYEKANRFRIEEIVESKYTDVNLKDSEGEYKVLTCNYMNDEIKYYFTDDQLKKIKETYSESKDSKTFEANKEKFKNLTEKYKTITAFKSTFVEDAERFTQINEIDLQEAVDNEIISLKTYRFFSYRANKNKVAFEIEAQGYTCS